MSDTTQGKGDARADTGAQGGGQLGVLLVCFDKLKAAGKIRHSLDGRLESQGDARLDTVVVRVNAKHKASVYDPRRVVQGTLTALLTWGVFGLVAGGSRAWPSGPSSARSMAGWGRTTSSTWREKTS